MADRQMRTRSIEAMAAAAKFLPGGVSSDVRLSGPALVFSHAEGPMLYDVDGHAYVDYALGMGPLILGHTPESVIEAVTAQARRGLIYGGQNEWELKVAELIAAVVPCAEMMRFSMSGSEAVHAALRLARGFTGRSKVVKFEGHYHGWLDPVNYSTAFVPGRSGDPRRPVAVPMCGGMAPGSAADLLIAPWNDAAVLTDLFAREGADIAAVIMEPIMCNTGCIAPEPGYLQAVRDLCTRHGALLIFDEVITGFRIHLGGAQTYLGVVPDLATFGKAVAAGLPLSVVAGRRDVMSLITERKVSHAGTFNSNPVVMAGAYAALNELARDRGALYERIRVTGAALRDGINRLALDRGVPMWADGPGPMFQVYFGEPRAVRNARDVAATDLAARDRFVNGLLDRGVRVTSRGLFFLSAAHEEGQIARTLEAVEDTLGAW